MADDTHPVTLCSCINRERSSEEEPHFEFITTTGPRPAIDALSRKLIRSYASRNSRKSKMQTGFALPLLLPADQSPRGAPLFPSSEGDPTTRLPPKQPLVGHYQEVVGMPSSAAKFEAVTSHISSHYTMAPGLSYGLRGLGSVPTPPRSDSTMCPVCGGTKLRNSLEIHLPSNEREYVREDHLSKPLTTILGAGRSDPFDVMPLVIGYHTHKLIDHYNQVFVKSSIPVNPKGEWFSYAISDSAVLHATLCCSAAHYTLLGGGNGCIPLEYYYHKGEAIRLINERLGDPARRTGDGTLAAIACLASLENLTGSGSAATPHVVALDRLVKLRGGIQTLGMNGLLSRLISWIDLCHASASLSKIHFTVQTFDVELREDLDIEDLDRLKESIMEVFHTLQNISLLVATHKLDVKEADQIKFSDKIYDVEHQVNSFSSTGRPSNGDISSHRAICGSCHLSMFIYIYWVLREIPIGCSIFDMFVKRLKDHLEDNGSMTLLEELDTELLLWVLFIGGMAAFGRSERVWFRTWIGRKCSDLGLGCWEDARSAVRRFAWVDWFCDPPSKALWNDYAQRDQL